MSRTVVRGAVIALVAAIVAVSGNALGIDTVWPVLLAAAVGLAAVPLGMGRVVAFVVGSLVSWFVLALRAGFLPDVAMARALVVVIGVLLLTALAAATAERAPLWAGLAGFVAFSAYYEPLYAASPTLFLSESPVALVTVLLAAAVGFAAGLVTELLTAPDRQPARRDAETGDTETIEEGVA
jgi:hypothetical protein